MKKEKDFKKIIKEVEDKDLASFFEILDKEEEKELKGFLARLVQLKKRIEPSQDLALKVLNRLLEEKSATNLSSPRPLKEEENLRSSFFPFKLKIQMHMPKILTIAIPAAVVVLIGLVVLLNPFGKENLQVAELKDIASDESMAEEAGVDFDSFLASEKQLREVDDLLNQVALSSTAEVNGFDTNQIDAELKGLETETDLNSFFSQENNLSEVDSLLSNF
ncbi:MAG: hypothetical protein KatS3mg098_044 [Candidatus Parcubacteria bacterium]|nr:MAG: hypothetical protein KatS3mg098_044 [Candidatus Parcubacteria bacterium]